MGFLKKLRKLASGEPETGDAGYLGEYPENMEGAYRQARFDQEEESTANEIQRVLASDRPPMTKATAAERLAKLEELKNNRIITEAEFEQIRQEIRRDIKAEQEKV